MAVLFDIITYSSILITKSEFKKSDLWDTKAERFHPICRLQSCIVRIASVVPRRQNLRWHINNFQPPLHHNQLLNLYM